MRSEAVLSQFLSRRTIPAEIPTGFRRSTENSEKKLVFKRSGLNSALAFGLSNPLSHIANSSPPKRATKSPGRDKLLRKLASLTSALSPALCPCESLISLKLSKSINTRTPVGACVFTCVKTLSVKYFSKVPLLRRPVSWSVVDKTSNSSLFAICSNSIPTKSAHCSKRNKSSSFQLPLAPFPQATKSPFTSR